MQKWLFLLFFIGYKSIAISQDITNQEYEKVRNMPADTNKVNAWIKLSAAAINKNYDSAINYANYALQLAEKLKFEKGIYIAHEQLANATQYKGDYLVAFNHYEIAYKYYHQKENKAKTAWLLNRMGESKRLVDEYEEALEYLQKSLRLHKELKDTNNIGSDYVSIGILYAIKGDKIEAEKYFLDAIEAFKQVKNEERENLTILNMGGLYREVGEYEKSIVFSEKARDYFLKQGQERRLAIAYYSLGVAYYETGQYEKSKNEYNKCLPIFEKLGDNLRINGTTMRLSEIALKQGDVNLSLKYANKAYEGLKSVGSKSTELHLINHLSEIYKQKLDFKKALEFKTLYHELKDSINNEETKVRIAELEQKYQNETKELQLAELSAKNEISERDKLIAERKVKEQRVMQTALISLSVLILVIALLIYNQYRINKRNNAILEEKNSIIQKSLNEKELLLKEIHHRVKNNLQFISSLLNLQARHVHDPQALSVLIDSKNRVYAMALVHQKLYQEDNLTGVQMQDFLNTLIDGLVHSYKIDRSKIVVTTEISPIYLDIDIASPLGLIVNELITNAFKYAFSNQDSGNINIVLKEEDEYLKLKVSDNGKGFPPTVKTGDTRQFGLKLIQSLVEKLNAEINYINEKGAIVEIKIKKSKS